MSAQFGMSIPLVAAPMSGGPTTPAMVSAAARAGALGLLAAGYKTVEAVEDEIKAVRADGIPFGVNVFAPNPVPVDPQRYRAYASIIAADADQFGLTLPSEPVEDNDRFDEKIELLLDDPVPMVSFTFGIPSRDVIAALQKAKSVVVQTVTTAEEAAQAHDAGVDMLAVQAAAAVGTVLLRATESGASATHQAALADPAYTETVLTRAFTGRPARGLRNAFIDAHEAEAPPGYPAIHHLTSPLRKAAAAAGQPDYVHLWAGTGFRHATAEPATDILRRLASDL